MQHVAKISATKKYVRNLSANMVEEVLCDQCLRLTLQSSSFKSLCKERTYELIVGRCKDVCLAIKFY